MATWLMALCLSSSTLAALVRGAGDGELVHQPVGDHTGLGGERVHVLVVVVGLVDVVEDLLLLLVQCERQRVGDDPGHVGLDRVLGARALGNGARDPQHQVDVGELAACRFGAGRDPLHRPFDGAGIHAHQDDDAVGDAPGKLEHPWAAGGHVERDLPVLGKVQVDLAAALQLGFAALDNGPHLRHRRLEVRQPRLLAAHGLQRAVAESDAHGEPPGRHLVQGRVAAGQHRGVPGHGVGDAGADDHL